ncbi:MAG: DUF5320 domain-containing protein [Bacteroidales bacterium]|nr:DUF5320 domain-containing protein [Bacteroidales bacterium]
MPGFDRTGPEGQGSQTGRRLGKCNPNARKTENQQNADEFSMGLGLRRGRGASRGSGMGNGRKQGRGFGRQA